MFHGGEVRRPGGEPARNTIQGGDVTRRAAGGGEVGRRVRGGETE